MGRRRFLARLSGFAGMLSVRPLLRAAPGPPRLSRYPFALGIASGAPTPEGIVLWTRLCPQPREYRGGLDPIPIAVRWEVAKDEAFRDGVARGTVTALPEYAHSVHVEVDGLQADRCYFYRFHAGDATSAVGRTRTTPPARATVARLRLAVASCQNYEQGYYAAYRHMARDDLDLVVHVGDYIYEGSGGHVRVRSHGSPAAVTLDDYRERHALYKSDPDLQAAHAAFPWIATWDDHDVENDYANDRSEGLDPSGWFLDRRAAAYRAYYEHMPLRRTSHPFGSHMRMHGSVDYGDLAQIITLDDRQYRAPQACPKPGRGGSNQVESCAELEDPARSLLGPVQEEWLAVTLSESTTRFNIVAQQTLMAQLDRKPGPGKRVWTDGWDGYPASRRKLMELFENERVRNPIVVGGDVHSFWVADLKPDFADPRSPIVASEFVGTSISSECSVTADEVERAMPDNPHVHFADTAHRGYLRLVLGRDRAHAELMGLSDVTTPTSDIGRVAAFVVLDGHRGVQSA